MSVHRNIKIAAILLGSTLAVAAFQNCSKMALSDKAGFVDATGAPSVGFTVEPGPVAGSLPESSAPQSGASSTETVSTVTVAPSAPTVAPSSPSAPTVAMPSTPAISLPPGTQPQPPILNEDLKPSIGSCGRIVISDIRLSVKFIAKSASGKESDLLTLEDRANRTITLDHNYINLIALDDGSVKEVFIVLNADGNKVLSSLNEEFNLKIPGALHSSLKIKLGTSVVIKKGHAYRLKLGIEPADQIVQNHSKCIFKPVIHSAVLVER